LYWIDFNTGAVATILGPGDGGAEYHISPDGRQVAIVGGGAIGFVDIDGGNWHPNVFSYEPIYTYSEMSLLPIPVWASDSSGVWVAIPPSRPEFPVPLTDFRMTFWFLPADGSPVKAVGTLESVTVANFNIPVISSDGQYVTFIGRIGDSRPGGSLHTIRISDGVEVQMPPTPTPTPEPQVPDQGCEP
jgi:hypothetical protein